MALESLKRAREVLETPLALRLDVLAGPAQNQSYTTDPGVTKVQPLMFWLPVFAMIFLH